MWTLSHCLLPVAIRPCHHFNMPSTRKRRCFEEGHRRKLLMVADNSPEAEVALYYCASRIGHTGGSLVLLYVIEPQEHQYWIGVRQVQLDEETNKARALFRLFRRKLNMAGFESVTHEEVIREGKSVDEIVKLIDEDEDIAILVLGAATDAKGPGPIISALLAGKTAGTFPIPINIVPGNLGIEDLKTLA
jgi:nucleotide-binding universal stress UspA family protein